MLEGFHSVNLGRRGLKEHTSQVRRDISYGYHGDSGHPSHKNRQLSRNLISKTRSDKSHQLGCIWKPTFNIMIQLLWTICHVNELSLHRDPFESLLNHVQGLTQIPRDTNRN